MAGQHLAYEHDVDRRIEPGSPAARQDELLGLGHTSDQAGDRVGVDLVRLCPSKPRTTATSVPCPLPVSASEPNNSTPIETTGASGGMSDRKRSAATMGPTVCELEGPIPIRNRSNSPTHEEGGESIGTG